MKTLSSPLFAAILLTIVALSLAGCGKSSSPREKTDSPSPELLKQITLTAINSEGLAKAIEQHRGHVVLVDFWATWCAPCKELFPHTVELHNRFPETDLAVITVSLDKPNQRDSVLAFLRQKRANTENYLNSIESDAEAFDAFAIEEGIPHLRIYDRAGKIFRTVNGNRPAEIEKAVVEAMGKGKAS